MSVEDAKYRLFAAAEHLSPRAWISHNPWPAVMMAVASGFVMARAPHLRHGITHRLLQRLTRLL